MIVVIKKLISGYANSAYSYSGPENQTRIDMMTEINKNLISELFDSAVVNPRLRQNFDLRNPDDNVSVC